METSVAAIQINVSHVKLNEQSICRFHGVPFFRQTAFWNKQSTSKRFSFVMFLRWRFALYPYRIVWFQIFVLSFFIEPPPMHDFLLSFSFSSFYVFWQINAKKIVGLIIFIPSFWNPSNRKVFVSPVLKVGWQKDIISKPKFMANSALGVCC